MTHAGEEKPARPEGVFPEESAPLAVTAKPEEPSDGSAAGVAGPPAPESPATAAAGPGAPPPRAKPRHPALVRAFRAGRAIEGIVDKVVKGGYEVRLGSARGFCPHSQIDVQRENEPERQIGQTYQFKITELRRGGEDVVLSRRLVLEEARSDEARAVRATLIEGALTQGRVVGTAPFGAFIDLGAGVLGLAHISELSHNRIREVGEAVSVGDIVPVRVLKLKESGRISLSLRRAQEDPWADVETRFVPGTVHAGIVRRLAEFGAFVELAPGVEALAAASEFPPAAEGWTAGLEVGGTGHFEVLSVDRRARRIALAPAGRGGVPAEAVVEGAELTGRIQRLERYGVFVWLGPGRVGLMPRALSGAPESGDLSRHFKAGEPVEVTVVALDEGGRRIRLCRKGVKAEAPPPPPPAAEPAPRVEEPPAAFGTTLADKLRAALEKRR